MSLTGKEVEIKLLSSEEQVLTKLAYRKKLQNYEKISSQKQKLISYYYDTPDRLLLKHHCALRLRKEADKIICGYKHTKIYENNEADKGLFQREEIEVPWGGKILPDKIKLDKQNLPIKKVQKILPANILTLSKILYILNYRRLILLKDKSQKKTHEMCLDRTYFYHNDKEWFRLEVELECLSAKAKDIQQLSEYLQKEYKLRPANDSKLIAGLCHFGLI